MKLSPLTVPYRAAQRAGSILVPGLFLLTAGGFGLGEYTVVLAGLLVLGVVATIAYEVAYYDRFRYELTDDTIDIHSGVISRREREIPYRRIQNVDIRRNVVQRLLGIAAVGFETAGGSETEGSIQYVSGEEADRLQEEIQRRKRGVEAAGDRTVPGPAPEALFTITPGELALVGALSFDARIVGALFVLVPGPVSFATPMVTDPLSLLLTATGVVIAIGLLVASWVLGITLAVINYFGFRLTRVGDEIRYERGLLRRYSGSIPLSKIQSITIEDNPVKRATEYASLTVETAGYAPGGGGDGGGSQAAIPIARRERVFAVAEEIEPFGEPAFARPPKRVRRRYALRYLIGIGVLLAISYAIDAVAPIALPWYAVAGLVVVVPAAAHLQWKHRGYWVGPDHIVTRNGFWRRTISVVPFYRVQTVIDSRTVFQRRWSVASVIVDTAGSMSLIGHDAAAVDIEIEDAIDLRETLNERLQEALIERRSPAGPFDWFDDEAVSLDPG